MTAPTTHSPGSPDPLIDEVRALKRAASERFGHDLTRIAEQLRSIERQRAASVVQPPQDHAPPRGRVA